MIKLQVLTYGGTFSPVSRATRNEVLQELMKILKSMKEKITANTIRKNNVDALIKTMNNEEEIDGETTNSEEEEEGQSSCSKSSSEKEESSSKN